MYFVDVLKQDQMFANNDWIKDQYMPIYNEQDARDRIKYLTRNLYKKWGENGWKGTQKEVDGIYVEIYQNPDYSEHMHGFFPGTLDVDMIHKNGTNCMDRRNCHVICIRHMDITDEEIDKVFDYCRRYIYNLNPENYRHKLTRKFGLEDVRKLAKDNGLREEPPSVFSPKIHLFYLPGNRECDWTIQFDTNENYIYFKATRFKVDSKKYYLHSSGGRPVYDLYEAQILLPRVIESYYDAYPKYLKMDLERTLNKLEG